MAQKTVLSHRVWNIYTIFLKEDWFNGANKVFTEDDRFFIFQSHFNAAHADVNLFIVKYTFGTVKYLYS